MKICELMKIQREKKTKLICERKKKRKNDNEMKIKKTSNRKYGFTSKHTF
jgi:hypothetical protein